MSEVGTVDRRAHGTATTNLYGAMGIASGLVAVNVLLMLVLSYTPAADVGLMLFSNFFVAVATFAVTVGGGHWLATTSVEKGNVPLAGVGVLAIQVGYGLFGAAILTFLSSGLRAPALGISAVVTAAITAVVTAVVYNVDHSFSRWNLYAAGLFVAGVVLGAVTYFVAPLLVVLASPLFFLGFLAYLVHEIWAVKTGQRGGTLVHAIGIYVAVMGVFVHVLRWVVRILAVLEE